VFHSYINVDDKNFKVMIDKDNCVNIIAKSVVEMMNLEAKPHPQPYNITWVCKTAQSIAQCCRVPI